MTEKDPSIAFPERLKHARELRGLNQSDLAAKTGLQASAISHFETGTRKPSFDNLRRLADKLAVTTDYLLGRVEEPTQYAGAGAMFRHFDKLSSEQREAIEETIKSLAKKRDAQEKKND